MTRSRTLFSRPTKDPRNGTPIAIPTTKGHFFGANIHRDFSNAPWPSQTPTTYINIANDLGIKWYRNNVTEGVGAAGSQALYTALRAAGIEPFTVIIQEPTSVAPTPISLNDGYATNYAAGLANGRGIGASLAGYCTYFEVCNELDFKCRIDGGAGLKRPDGVTYYDGSQRTDFDPAKMPGFFGWCTGTLDGLRQYIPDAKIGYATGAGFGGYIVGEMWMKGMDTTGAIVRDPVNVDFQGIHWYWGMGDPRTAVPSGGVSTNIFQQVWTRMGVPSIISEWGSSITDAPDQATQASQLTTRATEYWTNAQTDHIAGAHFYALFPNPASEGDTSTANWGLIQNDGTTIKPSYTAYKTYIAS